MEDLNNGKSNEEFKKDINLKGETRESIDKSSELSASHSIMIHEKIIPKITVEDSGDIFSRIIHDKSRSKSDDIDLDLDPDLLSLKKDSPVMPSSISLSKSKKKKDKERKEREKESMRKTSANIFDVLSDDVYE